ncbi:hypothetical protein DM02DRAFT_394379 [Periconia macrospinosa]|uniref:Uncharacterized protein n=1 Tax=Periconia macrospinosa TaxID=97972 RepID=A0A2V1DUE7_9PLEO|nr:hypothetical protein DM02DRAFT_394379 [Periconia macrospinosa]
MQSQPRTHLPSHPVCKALCLPPQCTNDIVARLYFALVTCNTHDHEPVRDTPLNPHSLYAYCLTIVTHCLPTHNLYRPPQFPTTNIHHSPNPDPPPPKRPKCSGGSSAPGPPPATTTTTTTMPTTPTPNPHPHPPPSPRPRLYPQLTQTLAQALPTSASRCPPTRRRPSSPSPSSSGVATGARRPTKPSAASSSSTAAGSTPSAPSVCRSRGAAMPCCSRS